MKNFIREQLEEALSTKCQTNGAIYKTSIKDNGISIAVKLPFNLNITDEEAKLLETNLHNVIEIVLTKYYENIGN